MESSWLSNPYFQMQVGIDHNQNISLKGANKGSCNGINGMPGGEKGKQMLLHGLTSSTIGPDPLFLMVRDFVSWLHILNESQCSRLFGYGEPSIRVWSH